jgi:hypothetical protein
VASNNRFERSRGSSLRLAKEGVDAWDKSTSFVGNATARRSTSLLDAPENAYRNSW